MYTVPQTHEERQYKFYMLDNLGPLKYITQHPSRRGYTISLLPSGLFFLGPYPWLTLRIPMGIDRAGPVILRVPIVVLMLLVDVGFLSGKRDVSR